MLFAACRIARRTDGSTRAAPARISSGDTSSGGGAPSNRRGRRSRGRSPPGRAPSTMAPPPPPHPRAPPRRSNARSTVVACASSRSIARRLVASTIRTSYSRPAFLPFCLARILKHDLIQRILDDPLGAGRLEAGDEIANGPLFDDGV